MSRRITSLLLLALTQGLPAQDDSQISVKAATYLSEALAIMRQASFHRDSIDWTELRKTAFATAAGAQVPVDTYDAIRGALRGLGDHHSFLQISAELLEAERARKKERGIEASKQQNNSSARSPFQQRRKPEGHLHEAGDDYVARIVIPSYGGSNPNGFAKEIQTLVEELDDNAPKGWIIDLRGNGGGNMWPMLAGIGPVLGEGPCGAFKSLDGIHGEWYYRDGVSGSGKVSEGGFIGATVAEPYVIEETAPVVVLIDMGTASSGEATAIAFKGRPQTYFIGTPSMGLSTSNQGFKLSDSANLVITVGLDVDRNGVEYPTKVLPDEEVSSPASANADEDPQLARAIEWLADW